MGAPRQFNDVLLDDFSGGLNNRFSDSAIKDNQASDIQNIDFEGAGTIQPRRGCAKLGTANNSATPILGTWMCLSPDRLDVPMRAWSSIVEFYHTGTAKWETLQTGLSVGLDYGAATYNGSAFWGNGVDSFTAWNGMYSLVNGALTGSEATVTLDSTTGFANAAGSAMINGGLVYYSAVNATQLLNCTGVVATPDNSAVAVAPVLYPSQPKGNLYAWHDFRLYVVSSNVTLNYSAVDDPTNFSGGGSSGFKSGGDKIKNIIPLEDFLVVIKENSIWKWSFASDGTPTKDLIVELDNVGAIGVYAAAQVENDIYYVAKDGNVRRLGRTANYSVGSGLRIDLSSTTIQSTITSLDSSDAAMIYFNKKLYIASKLSGDSANSLVLVYDYDYDAWSIYKGWCVSDWFVYEGSLYFGSSTVNDCYQALTGWKDDGASVSTKWVSKAFDFGIPHEMKKLRWIYVEGYISPGTTITAKTDYDTGAGITSQLKTISGIGNYVDTEDSISFSHSIWGEGNFADGGPEDYLLHKFRVRIQPLFINFLSMKMTFSTDGEDQVFRITKIAPYVRRETKELIVQTQLI